MQVNTQIQALPFGYSLHIRMVITEHLTVTFDRFCRELTCARDVPSASQVERKIGGACESVRMILTEQYYKIREDFFVNLRSALNVPELGKRASQVHHADQRMVMPPACSRRLRALADSSSEIFDDSNSPRR